MLGRFNSMDVILREPFDQLSVNSATEESNLACIHTRLIPS